MKNHNQQNKGIDDLILRIKESVWRRGGIFWTFWSIVVAAAFTFLVFSVSRILFPVYRDILAEDTTVQVIATGTRNSASLGTNIRLSSIRVNGMDLDLSKIKCGGGWQYSSDEAFLYAYNSSIPTELTVEIENVLSMELTFVSERGAGIVEILVNGKRAEILDLYSDTSWSSRTVSYDANVFVHPEQHGFIWALLFAVSYWLCGLAAKTVAEPVMRKIRRSAVALLLNALLALILTIGMWIMQYQDPQRLMAFLSGDDMVVLEGYVLVFLLLFFLYQICQSNWIPFTVLSVVLEGLLIVSNIKLNARGTPLLPWDFLYADAALSVADGYELFVSPVSVAVVACNAVVSYTLFRCCRHSGQYSLKWACTGGLAVALVLAVFINTTVIYGIWSPNTGSRVYQISNYYEENGFLISFVEYCNYLLPMQPPEGYSKETVTTLVEEIMAQQDEAERSENKKGKMPNIIAIMSESFWDVTTVENVTFAEDPLPVFHALQSVTGSGELLSHVFGGNTVISEFEFLTGFHSAFFPADYMVYGSSLDEGFCSAASFLSKQGYHTVAMHPYIATNYNRNTAYRMLGFQDMLFEDDFPKDVQRVRGYISDDGMFRQIAQIYEQTRKETTAPLFLFGITMQSHGGYWETNLHKQSQVSFESDGYLESTIAGMNDYFATLHSSDEALGNLISYFEEIEEETIVIYFGDHMSDVGSKAQKMLECQSWYQESTFSVNMESHTVPYVVWSNYDLEIGEHPMMDIGQLLPLVLERAGVQMPYFWHYLQQLRELLPAFNHAIAVNADHTEVNLNHLSQQQAEAYHKYQLLTYDYIWGGRYAAALWEIHETAE